MCNTNAQIELPARPSSIAGVNLGQYLSPISAETSFLVETWRIDCLSEMRRPLKRRNVRCGTVCDDCVTQLDQEERVNQ